MNICSSLGQILEVFCVMQLRSLLLKRKLGRMDLGKWYLKLRGWMKGRGKSSMAPRAIMRYITRLMGEILALRDLTLNFICCTAIMSSLRQGQTLTVLKFGLKISMRSKRPTRLWLIWKDTRNFGILWRSSSPIQSSIQIFGPGITF